jgi:hypothetical protein
MPQVFFSPYFAPSLAKAAALHGALLMTDLVADFVHWKETGANPTRLSDKSSARDDQGRVFRPFQQNQYRHVSFGLIANGDPVLAFRPLGKGDIMAVCITTKHEMFALKGQFRTAYQGQFPIP